MRWREGRGRVREKGSYFLCLGGLFASGERAGLAKMKGGAGGRKSAQNAFAKIRTGGCAAVKVLFRSAF